MGLLDLCAPAYDSFVYDVFEHKHTQYLAHGGRGSLKSSTISLIIPPLMIANPNVNGLILRQVGNTLKDSVYNQMIWAIDALGLAAHFKLTKNPLEIVYIPTGQKIYFRGADDPLKLKSIKCERGYIGITWFEELDQFQGEEAIRNILQSANRGGSEFWNFFSFNPPKSRDNWANMYALDPRTDRLTIHTTYLDAPAEWLGEQFIDDANALKQSNELAYRHEYLGEATGTGGSVFDNIEEREITDEEIETLGYFYYGIDYGFAVDPFVWVKVAYDKSRKYLYILDEIYQRKLSNERAVEMIKKRQSASAYITADSAEPKSISEMNGRGLKVIGARKGPDSVDYGIKWLQNQSKIIIDSRRTPNAYTEFAAYEYERDRDGNFISAYPDYNNHCLTGDTLVNTYHGAVPISELIGETGFLYCYDTWLQIPVLAEFCNVRKTRDNAQIYRIELENGLAVECTGDHLILTSNRGYVPAAELTVNDDVITIEV